MKYLRYLVMVGLLTVPLAYSQAAVRFGVAVGFGPGYVAGPPACPYGYYPDYPYACAPYGYYGPSYFVGGVFIGAGPWYHPRSYWGRPVYGRPFYGRPFVGRERFEHRGFEGRGFEGRDRDRDFHGNSFRGGRR